MINEEERRKVVSRTCQGFGKLTWCSLLTEAFEIDNGVTIWRRRKQFLAKSDQFWSTLRNQAQIQPNVRGFSPSSQVYPGKRIPLILENLEGFEVAGLLPYSLVNQIITGFFSEPDCTGLSLDSVHFLAPAWTCLEEPIKSFGTQ